MKIKSKLNGEVSNVRADIAREMVKLGVAELLEPDTGDPQAGTVYAGNETYRLPKPGDWKGFPTTWSVEVLTHEGGPQHLVIKRVVTRGRFADTVMCSFHPDSVHDRRYANGGLFCSAFGVPVPDHILAEYRERWKAHKGLRATEEKRPVPGALDAKADKAFVERGLEESAAHGIIQGQRLTSRPDNARSHGAVLPASTAERVGEGEGQGDVTWVGDHKITAIGGL